MTVIGKYVPPLTVASLQITATGRPWHEADSGDDSGRRRFISVETGRGERGDLEERAAVVEQLLDAVAREQLAAAQVPLAGAFGAAEGGGAQPLTQLGDERALGGVVREERRIGAVHPALDALHRAFLQ